MARKLAASVEDLDWDEHSLWGRMPSEGIFTGYLLLHHGGPLTGECSCQDGHAEHLCAHLVALALAFLGDDTELADRLTALPHQKLVALVMDLTERSTHARQATWARLATVDCYNDGECVTGFYTMIEDTSTCRSRPWSWVWR